MYVLRGREWLILPLVLLYVISPIDLMPFLPLDDVLVMLLGWLAFRFARRSRHSSPFSQPFNKDQVIDVKARIIE